MGSRAGAPACTMRSMCNQASAGGRAVQRNRRARADARRGLAGLLDPGGARARQLYDEMLLLVALGAALVLLGDLASHVARAWVRRA